MNPYGDIFCHIFSRLFDASSYSSRGKMATQSAISAALRRRLFIVQIDAPRNFPKPFSTIKLRVKVRKVRKNRTQQLYNADLGLLINVTPIIVIEKRPLSVLLLCRNQIFWSCVS